MAAWSLGDSRPRPTVHGWTGITSPAKPSWTPAPRTIGLIWQILYPVIIATFSYVFVQVGRGWLPLLVALPFAINLVSNLLFMPIQAGMRNRPLATADIIVVWGTIVWMMVAIRPHHRWVAAAVMVHGKTVARFTPS